MSREDIRDVMRPHEGANAAEAFHDTDREYMRPPVKEAAYDMREGRRDIPRNHEHDMMHPPVPEPMYNPDRDIRGQGREMMQPTAHESMHNPARDPHGHNVLQPAHDPMYAPERDLRGQHEMMAPPPSHQPHEAMYSPDRGMTMAPDHAHHPQYPAHEGMYGRDYPRENNRDLPLGNDFMPNPQAMHDHDRDMRRDAPRETRMEPGRDMRDLRRDPNRDMMMRPSGRATMRPEPMRDNMRPEPMRDNRPYMQDGPDYGDNDQNLLPPVASLM